MKGKWTEICDICLHSKIVRYEGNLKYFAKCWEKCEEGRKCFICDSRKDILMGTNFSRNYICKKCLKQQEQLFILDMNKALYGER